MAKIASLLFVAAAIFAFAGCNPTVLQSGEAKQEGKKESPSDKNDSNAKRRSNDGVINDDEEDVADKPVAVSGAYLTCASVQVPGAESDYDRYGCVVEKNKTKIARNDFDADYSIEMSPVGPKITSTIVEPADAISLWHVFVKVPSGTKEKLVLKAVVHWKNSVSSIPEVLTAELSTQGKLHALRFGMSSEFHLGNNKFEASACRDRVNTVELFGTVLSIKFTVAVDATKTAFHVNGICGLDSDRSALIRVLRGTTVIKTVQLFKSDVDIVFGIGSLAAGPYVLELETVKLNDGDFDDFIIGDITVVSDKLVTGELPPP